MTSEITVTDNGEAEKDHRAKVITISSVGPRWVVEFDGVVTRRDIHRINRILTVEFSRAQRRYSVQRKKEIRLNLAKEATNAIREK